MTAVSTTTKDALSAQYDLLRRASALFVLDQATLISVTGKNSIPFINGLVTNDLKSLQDGQGTIGAFLNLQAKVTAITRFYRIADGVLLQIDNKEAAAAVVKNLSKFVLAGEFFINELNYTVFSVQGPGSAEVLTSVFGGLEVGPDDYSFIKADSTYIARHDRTGSGGFDVYVSNDESELLASRLKEAGAVAGDAEVLNVARLEAGIPLEGVDVSEANILLEAGYEKAVSYTKGCYLGQEIIARIHWRGQPARQLRGLLVDGSEVIDRGTELWAADGKKVGEVTSSVFSLGLDRVLALGYVHRYYLTAGTQFTLKKEEKEIGTATLTELPFIK